MTKFQDAMKTECPDCGYSAQVHRLTPSGTFYCLTLNETGRERYMPRWSRGSGLVDLNAIVYRCKVMYLNRSRLPKEMGKAIHGYLNGSLSPIRDTP